jgi:glycosyltransferase involved in cell wall biosynthesis
MPEQKIVHLVPYDGIGGVEAAARSMVDTQVVGLDFRVEYIYSATKPSKSPRRWGIMQILRCIHNLARHKPDILILSLWRSCIVGTIVKLLRPNTRIVLLLHYPLDVHQIDKLFTKIAVLIADEIWADSTYTLKMRGSAATNKTRRVISFVANRLRAPEPPIAAPRFIYWGRINAQKGLNRAISLFAKIQERYPNAEYKIIGPDGGVLSDLKYDVHRLGLTNAVTFAGAMTMDLIVAEAQRACFYLQCSIQEGMAMSVVEAMQLGLVPVVTPVGEIGNYCIHQHNALLIRRDTDIIDEIDSILSAPHHYSALRESAISTWLATPLYTDSMISALREMLSTKINS